MAKLVAGTLLRCQAFHSQSRHLVNEIENDLEQVPEPENFSSWLCLATDITHLSYASCPDQRLAMH